MAVDVKLAQQSPLSRLVQLNDLHVVARDLFAVEVRAVAGKPLTDEDVDLLYHEHLLQVELVQLQQMAVLRCLAKHHGLKRVYIERLTAEDMPGLMERAKMHKELQQSLDARQKEASALMKQIAAAGNTDSERYQKAKTVEKQLQDIADKHQAEMLDLGAAVRLMVAGELAEVLPLDDARLLDLAKPVVTEGRLVFDKAKVAEREDAMVKNALAKDALAVIVLGGSHDLTGSVQRVGPPWCEYVRVTVKAYAELDR